MTARRLTDYLEASAAASPDRTAVVDPSGQAVTYGEINERADALAAFLAARGVRPGDRVGIVVRKSVRAVISLYGVMKAGAACVPVDASAPLDRRRRILTDCSVRALIADRGCLDVVTDPTAQPLAALVVADTTGAADTINGATSFQEATTATATAEPPEGQGSDLAYILYTSGSTGTPKGVTLTHDNMVSFVEWCSRAFEPTARDRFSSHAPFHFDLSVLDVYLAAKHGAAVYLVSEDLGKSPKDLARFIAANRLTIWYSTPSALTLLLGHGRLEAHDASSLRIVLFAGEVFPVRHLRELQQHWPRPAYFNLYGPTETNVCTFARIPDTIPDDRDRPYPIGFPCDHCRPLVLDGDGHEVAAGEEGLLHISGPSVFSGYWNRPAESAPAFVERHGLRWYNTGDVVRWHEAEGFVYVGRKDRMVKRRGYRIELGEIERALSGQPCVRDVAVVAVPDAEAGVKIVAFVSWRGEAPSIIALKTFCGSQLPAYMSPDQFFVRRALPTTSTDKTDYQALRAELLTSGAA